MFRIMILSALTLLHAYVFWRAAGVPAVARRLSRKFILITGGILWAGVFLVIAFGRTIGGYPGAILEFLGMDWLAVLFLISVCLLAVDVATLFGFLFKCLAPILRGWTLAAGLLISAFAIFQGMRPPVVNDYEIRIKGLPAERDGTVIIALSDLHLGSLIGKRWMASRVAQVQALHPDAIVLLGDLIEGHGEPPREFIREFRKLSAPLGVWAVTGNHEYHGGSTMGVRLLEEAGIRFLHDRWAEASPGLVLAGVDDLTSRRRSGRPVEEPVVKAFAGRPQGAVIFLSHTPWGAEEAARLGAGLMLSGHTHGGQIWPFDLLELRIYPLMAGRYEVNSMPVLVTRGAGT